jgi:phosphotransferase family enzyme
MNEWIGSYLDPVGPLELEHDRSWSTVVRVPLAGGDAAWFKHCKPVQAFEPRLTASLYARWPDRVAEVIAWDDERSWLLLADAGTPFGAFGNAPEAWEAVLPLYAELQIGEAAHAGEHLEAGVPDLRPDVLPSRYAELPAAFEPRFAALCEEVAADGIPASVQHDDLHIANVYAKGDSLRVLDWGDASVAHPFFSLFETFRFLENMNKLPRDDPWFARLRDAYLEPWGADAETFERALVVGAVAHVIAWLRQRDALDAKDRPLFDKVFPDMLEYARSYIGA